MGDKCCTNIMCGFTNEVLLRSEYQGAEKVTQPKVSCAWVFSRSQSRKRLQLGVVLNRNPFAGALSLAPEECVCLPRLKKKDLGCRHHVSLQLK